MVVETLHEVERVSDVWADGAVGGGVESGPGRTCPAGWPGTMPDTSLPAFGRSAIAAPPPGWEAVTITITGLGPMTGVSGAVTVGGVPRNLSIDADAVDSAEDLRKLMYAEHTGTWYRATLTVTPDGRIASDFDYDGRPRDPDHLPDWHPARRP